MRNIYKDIKLKGECFLYPYPVQVHHKYLIYVLESHVEFIQYVLEKEILESFDATQVALKKKKVHTDNKTIIYELDFDNLEFRLLKNREINIKRAKTIEKLLGSKIINCLKKEQGSLEDFIKCYEKQKKCSTCKELGIEDERLEQVERLLKKTLL